MRGRTGGWGRWGARVLGAALVLAGPVPAHAAPLALPLDAARWQASINGAPLTAPLVFVGKQAYLPVAALAAALGAHVATADQGGATTVSLTTGDGLPPVPWIADPRRVLVDAADLLGSLGSGYAAAVSSGPATSPAHALAGPATPVAPLPGYARARIAAATLTAQVAGAGRTAPPGSPSLVTLTVAEYSGAGYASEAFAAWLAQTARGGAWPGVTAPPPYPTLTAHVPPLGNADAVWTGPTSLGPAVLGIVRVNNWLFTSVAVYPAGSDVAADASLISVLWTMQAHRMQALAARPAAVGPIVGGDRPPVAGPPTGALPPVGTAPVTVVLNTVDLGQALPTDQGYALPLSSLAQALEIMPFRTGSAQVNLQAAGAPDGGIIPPVLINPKRAVVPLRAFAPYVTTQTTSVPNSALIQTSPGTQAPIDDWGRLAGYSVLEVQPSAGRLEPTLPEQLWPQAVLLSVTEFSTASGAEDAVRTFAPSLAGSVKGEPLSLGDLDGPHGEGPVTAAMRVTGQGNRSVRAIWLLTRVDNWEVLVAADGPAATFHLRNAWPILVAQTAWIASGAAGGAYLGRP